MSDTDIFKSRDNTYLHANKTAINRCNKLNNSSLQYNNFNGKDEFISTGRLQTTKNGAERFNIAQTPEAGAEAPKPQNEAETKADNEATATKEVNSAIGIGENAEEIAEYINNEYSTDIRYSWSDDQYIKLSDEQKAAIISKYGNDYASKLISGMETYVPNNDHAETLAIALNANNGKYKQYFLENPEVLIANLEYFTMIFKYSSLSPQCIDVTMNTIKNMSEMSAKEREWFDLYKRDSGFKMINEDSRMTQYLAKLIDKYGYTVKEPTAVTRGEGYGVLYDIGDAELDGINRNLASLMEKAAKSGNPDMINKVIELVKNNNYTVTQKRNMSVGYDGKFNDFPVQWTLEAQPGSKVVDIDAISSENREKEFLFKSGSRINITNIDYDYNDNQWQLEGTFTNAE